MFILINVRCFRAILSEITRPSVQRAISSLGPPNKNISDAVDVRSELDLRIGKLMFLLALICFHCLNSLNIF